MKYKQHKDRAHHLTIPLPDVSNHIIKQKI